MQPMKLLGYHLQTQNSSGLFRATDFRPLFENLSDAAFKTLLSRSVASGLLIRVCRNIYLFPKHKKPDGLVLFHTATLLRSQNFNYISLETALSDAGVISQIPMNSITIMSSGRSSTIDCGSFGSIHFSHTKQTADELQHHLTYDVDCGMWRADIEQAIKDLKRTRRNLDLIDWEVAHELIQSISH